MKESYLEGVATHGDPESCVGVRKDVVEALTGERMGRAIEPRNQTFCGADVVNRDGRQHDGGRYCEPVVDPTRSKNLSTYGRSMHGNREVLSFPVVGTAGRIGKPKGTSR